MDNHLTRYIQEKSPFLHDIKFDLSLKEYPLGPVLLPIPLDSELLDYRTNALEVLHRWMNFQNYSDQIDLDDMVDYELTIKSQNNKQIESKQIDQEDLSDIVPKFILDQIKQKEQEKSQKTVNIDVNKTSLQINTQSNWLRLSKQQRVEIYMDSIRSSFVDPKTLVNPKDPNIKQKRVYKVMPNIQEWKHTYIHASISGGLDEIDKGKRGFMKVTEETQISKQFEYYCSSNIEGKSERFSFVRNYTCQRSTKGTAGENYFLVLLPENLYRLAEKKVESKTNFQTKPLSQQSVGSDAQGNSDDTVYIISLKGQKSVLTKAGGGKKSDYLISYKEEEDKEKEEYN